MAGAAAACLPTLRLTQVSLPARPRPRSVLLCVLTPWLSSMAQPDLRLHPVCGRRRSEAAMEAAFDSCRKAARGSSMVARTEEQLQRRAENERRRYTAKRLALLKERFPEMPPDVLQRAPLRQVSVAVRRFGDRQSPLSAFSTAESSSFKHT